MRYIVDSYAWIEYLEGGKAGEKVNKILHGKNEIFSLNLSVAEIISRVKRKNKNTETAYKALTSNSKIIEITPETAKHAGILHAEIKQKIKDFGLADSIILATAKKLKAKIITRDEHFRNFKEAVFIK